MVDRSAMVLVSAFLALTGGAFAPLNSHAEEAMKRVHPYKGMWIPGSGEVTLPQWMEPGSGLLIDHQNQTLVVTIFTYDEEGAPVWYLASGNVKAGVLETTAFRFSGGSCLYCDWTEPSELNSRSMSLTFDGNHLVTLRLGDSDPIKFRSFPFDSPGFGSYSGQSQGYGQYNMFGLQGRWLAIAESGRFSDGEEIVLDRGPQFIDPGGIYYRDSEFSEALGCYSPFRLDHEFSIQAARSYCVATDILDGDRPITYTAFWGDVGPTAMVGRAGAPPPEIDQAGDERPRLWKFRLSGPPAQGEEFGTKVPKYVERGMWIIPQEPGSGFMFDWQNETLVFAIFTYDENGEPIWYQGSAEFNGYRATGEMQQFHNGSCLVCEYEGEPEPGELLDVTFEFTSKNTARFKIENGDYRFIRALAFDVPNYREFGGLGPYGRPALLDMTGKWAFVSQGTDGEISRAVEFDEPVTRNAGKTVAWVDTTGSTSLRCDAKSSDDISPACRILILEDGQWSRLFSVYWADIGEDELIGYKSAPDLHSSTTSQRDEIVFGFRLTGPE